MRLSKISRAFIACAALLLLFGVLQNPAPVGFETRPSSEIPPAFFAVFALGTILAIVAIAVALWRMNKAIIVAPFAAIFNILPPLADQAGLLHKAPTPGSMIAMETLAVVDSIVLVYLAYIGRSSEPSKSRL
jgi:hypothetical protein